MIGGGDERVSGMLGPILQPDEALLHQVPYEGGFAHAAPAHQENLRSESESSSTTSGARGSRAAPPGTAALWVQWPQALGPHLEELHLLFVASILADPAEHAAQNARGCKLGRGHRAQAGLTACPSTRQERLAPHTRTAGPAGTPQAWIICWGCGVFK